MDSNEGPKGLSDRLATLVLDQVPTPVMAVDRDYQVLFMNEAGRKMLGKDLDEIRKHKCSALLNTRHCNTPDCRMTQAMERGGSFTARNEVNIDGQLTPIEYTTSPLYDDDGTLIGGVEYVLDITEQIENEERLRQQSQTIMEISTPVIGLWDGVLLLPVVGIVDTARAMQMMKAILEKIEETAAQVVILDIQGVATVDTAVANHLLKMTKAARLMGCRCIISGMSPAVAMTLVQLGINLAEVDTKSTLKDALKSALNTVSEG